MAGPDGPSTGDDVVLDVVICTYQRAPQLDQALAALARQHPAGAPWRVLVVDNNSTDDTPVVVAHHQAEGRIPGLRRVLEAEQGLTAARVRGVHETSAPWVAFVDDDCLVDPGWAAAAVDVARRHPDAGAFGGRVVLDYVEPPRAHLASYGWAFAEQDLGPDERPVDCLVGTGMVINRSAVEASGWLLEQHVHDRVGKKLLSGGDVELALRLAGTGRSLWYAPGCDLRHVLPPGRTAFSYLVRLTRSLGVSSVMASALTWQGSPRGWARATAQDLARATVAVVGRSRRLVRTSSGRIDVALAASYEVGRWTGAVTIARLLATGRCGWFGEVRVEADSYLLVDVELTAPLAGLELRSDQAGIGLVSRRSGRVVGFALHPIPPGTRLAPAEVTALLDPEPVEEDPSEPARTEGGGPTVTVAICTRDRPELLQVCLASLLALDEPPDEILVVDNAPADARTRDLVATLGVRYEVEPCPGLDVARNLALRSAGGDVVAFVDDDVVVDRHWLGALRDVWSQHPDAGAVTGQILPFELETPAQVAFEHRGGFRGGNRQIRYDSQDRADNAIYPYSPGMFGAGANLSVRRRVATALGGFDEALDTGPSLPGGGDIDMMHRVIRRGSALVYEPRAVVFHRHRRDTAGLRRQYDSWGRSLMAYAVKTYRADPTGRAKLRLLLRWFLRSQLRELRRPGSDAGRSAALAELRGGVAGLLGTYGRSRRRIRRIRRSHGRPTVAILPWGDVIEDYTDPIGLSITDFAEEQSGGWLFGFAEALRRAGVDTVIVCWSSAIGRPERRLHGPTGAVMWFLPTSRLYRAARARLSDPYAWNLRDALGTGRRGSPDGLLARVAAPYLTTTPFALARTLRRESCVAVLNQEYEEGRFDVSVVLGRLLGLPVFATFQGGDHTRTFVERRLRRRTIRGATGLIVSAEHEVERLVETYGVDARRVERVPNPFDPASVPRLSKGAARASLDIDLTARVAVWHGRVDIQPKGLDVLIEAWTEVRRTCATRPMLLLLGTGPGAGWLHDRIRELELDDVVWRDEYVLDRRVIGAHLSAGDVFVLPSRQEGFPVAPVEAMAVGLPVVAADAPGVRSVVGEGDEAGGIVVAREDSRALAQALCQLLDDHELARELGAIAERRVAEHFSLEAVGSQLRARLLAP